MARVNITVPDELLARARAAGLSVSACAAQGLAAELDRRASREQIERYLAELDEELGPVPAEQAAAATAWANAAFGPAPPSMTTRTRRTGVAPAPARRPRRATKAGAQVL